MRWNRNVLCHYLKCCLRLKTEYWNYRSHINYNSRFSVPGTGVFFRDLAVCNSLQEGTFVLERHVYPPRIGSYKSVRITELSFLNSFLPQQWKIVLRQSNEKIRLRLVCLSSHNNLSLPLSFYFSVAGAALMDISEVHKRVHLELDDNVSAEHGGRVKVGTLVYIRPANCHSTIALQLHRRPSKTIALYVCVLDSLPFFFYKVNLASYLKNAAFPCPHLYSSEAKERELVQRRERNRFRLSKHLLPRHLPGK